MAARLEWKDGSLLLGGCALHICVVDDNGRWEAYGDASYGPLLHDTWEREADARQDVVAGVRRLLKAAGVEVA